MAYETLHMTIWNCNGSLWTDVGYFEDTFKNTDIAMYIETHQGMASKLPNVQGYIRESICRPQTQTPGSTRGLGSMIECMLCIRT